MDAMPCEAIFLDIPVILWSSRVHSRWFRDVVFIFGDHLSTLALVCLGEVSVERCASATDLV